MSVIGFFGIDNGNFIGGQRDRSYIKKLQEIIGPGHQLKVSFSETGVDYFATFAAKAKAADLDAVICTDVSLLWHILKATPDYKQAYHKTGKEKAPTLNFYQGSFITLDGFRIGRERPLDVLFLNPLEHLRTVPEAPYIYKRLISKITKPDSWFPEPEFKWEIATESTIQAIHEKFKSALLIAIDIETDKDSPHRTINCSGYCGLFPDGTTHAVVIPTISMWGVKWMREFNSLAAPKVLQNGLYDNLYFLRYGSPVYNWLYDTQHLFHSWYSELPKRLDYITAFSVRRVRYWKDDGKSGGLHGHYEYNAKDGYTTLMSCLSLIHEMPQWAKDNYLMEFPMVFPCLHMEADGLSLDKAEFDASKLELETALGPMEEQLERWVGKGFNPGSPVQVKKLLKVLGCANKQGIVESSDDAALTAAAALHPLNERILSQIQSVREKRKLLSTYMIWEKFWNDRLYYKSNPAGTDTGRLASSESSFWCGFQIQNVPRGKEVKRYIRSDAGWLLGENDFPQSEARCVGYISGCKSLIDLVEGPHDYHSWNAQAFFGIPYETIYDEVTKKTLNKEIRDLSKRTNHGANYNMGAKVMLETMGPKKVAEARRVLGLPQNMPLLDVCAFLLAAYERTYPEVKKDWYEDIKRVVSITKKLVSPLGWTRYFFADVRSHKPSFNAAVAHGPQNLSVSIINKGVYRVWRETVYGTFRERVRVKAQIHDSLLYCFKGEDTPNKINQLLSAPVEVKDIKGVVRTMMIHPDVSAGKTHWSMLK